MSDESNTPHTHLARSTREDIHIRGKSLTRDIMGQMTFTQLIYFHVCGREPTAAQVRVVDACLVALAEHGLTPSALATRMVYTSAPEAMQAAVAAGLLGVGSLFVGTVEGCAAVLSEIVDDEEGMKDAALRVAREHRRTRHPIPGFGHPQHKPDDPRSLRLFEIAESEGTAGLHQDALMELGRAVDEVYGKHITINATGAVAAVLADCDVPVAIMRGFALIARCAGLVGHVHEEQRDPAMRAIWRAADSAVPYAGDDGE
jgi:citrate synthase